MGRFNNIGIPDENIEVPNDKLRVIVKPTGGKATSVMQYFIKDKSEDIRYVGLSHMSDDGKLYKSETLLAFINNNYKLVGDDNFDDLPF